MKNLLDFSNFKGDLLGGLTAGVVALPLALAFGVSSGLGASAGLYGAIFIGFFAALFGGTPTQISGPTAPMTAVSMIVVAGIIANFNGVVSDALPAILLVFLLGGLFQIGIGLLGLGTYIKFIPYPVVSGFMTAIGVIILITQILPSLGYYPTDDSEFVNAHLAEAEEVILDHILHEEAKEGILVLEDFHETIERANQIHQEDYRIEAKVLAKKDASGVIGAIKTLPRALQHINWLEVILSLSTILIIYGFKKITTAIPSTLIALVVVSGLAVFLKLDYHPINEIPSGLPIPHFEMFASFKLEVIYPYIITAFTLALLGAIDSLLTSVVADNMTKTKHNPNQELIGQGIGNSISAVFGGIPGAGATIRTVVNIQSGGKTKLSGMIAAIILLIVLVALGPIASQIPAAVLSGILITVGIGVMDYKGLKAIPNMPTSEVLIMIMVLLLSVFWNLVFAVGLGLVGAALLFMKEMGSITEQGSEIEALSVNKAWKDENKLPKNLHDEVFIAHINGPLFFGSTSFFQKIIEKIPSNPQVVIFRMDKMHYLDQSGLYVLEDAFIQLIEYKATILVVGIQKQPTYMLEKIDIVPDLIPTKHTFGNFKSCLQWVKENVHDDDQD